MLSHKTLASLGIILLFGSGTFARATETYWQTTSTSTARSASIGLLERGSLEYGSVFQASCSPIRVRVQFDDQTNSKMVESNVYPLVFFLIDNVKHQVGFDTLKWSDVPGGWQAQLEVEEDVFRQISNAKHFSVLLADNSHGEAVLGEIRYPEQGMQNSFRRFVQKCF